MDPRTLERFEATLEGHELEELTAHEAAHAASLQTLLESQKISKRQAIPRMLWLLQFCSTSRSPGRRAWIHSKGLSNRIQVHVRPVGLLFQFLFVLLALTSAWGQVLLLPGQIDPPSYLVSSLELSYARPHPDQPPLDELLPLEVRLVETEFGWAAPHADAPGVPLRIGDPSNKLLRLEASGLARVLRGVVVGLTSQGLYGVDARPSSDDIDLDTERDLRPENQTILRIIISVGRIHKIRTIAGGGRIQDDWKINNEAHTRILERSPLQPSGAVDDDTTDLLNRRALEDYLYRLNRHPGRRVEAALSPAEEPGEIVLDYRVLESKPWYAYAQASNTGTTRTTEWQSRAGVTHNQFTGRDDTLSIEYLNAGGDGVNNIRIRYQAPFFGPERPEWMNRRKGDPKLLDWIPREKIPWWGVDRLRWEVDFGWGRSRADRDPTIGSFINDLVTSTQFQYGGRFIKEVWQHRDFFVDVWAGLRIRDLRVKNKLTADNAPDSVIFLIPSFGIHADRINQLSTLNLNLSIRGSNSDISEEDLDGLGRDNTDGQYAILDFDLGYTTFLEPLLFPKRWRDPSTELSSTLAHELAFGFRGQHAFDYRLIPQLSYSIGGLHTVRGYDQSAVVGDSVWIGSIEYRFHLPRALPIAREPLRIPLLGDFRAAPQQVYGRPDWDLTFRAYVDFGHTTRNDRFSTGAGVFEFNQTLIGAGIGAELQIKSNIRARIDWATALKATDNRLSNPTDVGDSQIHVLFSILY
jgi:hemolysin activation/secretion protein